jgi:hypothetical protein
MAKLTLPAVAGTLHFAKGLHRAAVDRAAGAFDHRAYRPLVGAGGIGREVGRLCVALGMRVLGARRHPDLLQPLPAGFAALGRAADLDGFLFLLLISGTPKAMPGAAARRLNGVLALQPGLGPRVPSCRGRSEELMKHAQRSASPLASAARIASTRARADDAESSIATRSQGNEFRLTKVSATAWVYLFTALIGVLRQ